MKYNYTKAAAIFEKHYNLCCDPWTLGSDEKQQERRNFMRALTRHDKDYIKLYTDFIQETKHDVCEPWPGAKSRVYDFDLMREYDELINEIENFEN